MNEVAIMPETTDRIERTVVFDAPQERVWKAITEVEQFNRWFGVQLESPFRPGAAVSGRLKEMTMTIWIEEMDAPDRFSFRWHPYAIDTSVDYSDEPTTLITFSLTPDEGGTRLEIVESGFDAIPEGRRTTAFTMNGRGWTAQVENLRKYLAASDFAGEAPCE